VISAVSQIVIPVTDQEAAKEFWTTVIGFDVTTDAPYRDGQRWIEVTPPDRAPSPILSNEGTGSDGARADGDLPDSPVFFTCADVERTYRELAERGVHFTTPPRRLEFGWWSVFEDHEGTRYALG
jgi:predicted enzyme related to lactoylglutathione lyase